MGTDTIGTARRIVDADADAGCVGERERTKRAGCGVLVER